MASDIKEDARARESVCAPDRPEEGSPDLASPPLTTGSTRGSSPCVSHQRPCGDTQSLGRGAVAGDRGMHLKLNDSTGQGVKHNLFEKV
ncbi:hypothetical protein Q8A67_012802 [Cirrhinus molitorella]|uniref:Uncharacterized protein n=1 Tax=Cirrhinus molitorella TaxID=172907 RepID=A0AA88PNG2_9TELE|nr:hypothetical protein Q8A67_012802 [Cirrhinus molitorella]